MNYISMAHDALRSSAIYGFAGYGAATVYSANPALAARIGVIYALAQHALMQFGFKWMRSAELPGYCAPGSVLGLDLAATIACRSFNLIGNRGMAILAGAALLRFVITPFRK